MTIASFPGSIGGMSAPAYETNGRNLPTFHLHTTPIPS
jgi:hypothetical protein